MCAKSHGLVCSVFVALKESGQGVVLKTVKDIVFKVSRLCEPPMWQNNVAGIKRWVLMER